MKRTLKLILKTALGLLMLLILLPFFLMGLSFASNTVAFNVTAVKADGVVVGYETEVTRRPGKSLTSTTYPIRIRYTTAKGESIQFKTTTGASNKPYEIGAPIKVLYNPANPNEARADTFVDNGLVAIVGPLISVAAVILGGAVWWLFIIPDFKAPSNKKTSPRLRNKLKASAKL